MEIENKKWITVWQARTNECVTYANSKEKVLFASKDEALQFCQRKTDLISCKVVRKKVKNQNYYFNEFNKLKKLPVV